MADTASLVVALSAQLTKFEKDMRDAGVMAEKATKDIESKFNKMAPSTAASFFGNLFAKGAAAAISAAEGAVRSFIDQFKELQKTAEYTGLSMQWLYGLEEAGKKFGSSIESTRAGVKSLAFLLDEMQRGGDNALKTLLDANPQFMKGVNRDTMDVIQNQRIVGDIIAKAKNDIQAIDIAKNLGIPPESVKLWQQGGDAMAKLAAESGKAAPDMERLAAMSKLFSESLDTLIKFAKENALAGLFFYLNYLATAYKTILETILPVIATINTAAGEMIKTAIANLEIAQRKISDARGATYPAAEDPMTAGQTGARVKIERGGPGASVDPFARQKAAVEGEKAFERAAYQIEKNTALIQADTAAVGANAYEQERLRVETLLNVAAMKQYGEISEATAAKIKLLSEAAGAAKQRNAELAGQLQKINAASQQFGQALSSAFGDAIVDGKKLNDVLSELLKTLAKAAINSTIMSMFTPGAGQSTSAFGSIFSSLLRGGGGTPLGAGGIGSAQAGTDFAPGGLMMVGERGPELLRLPRGSQVIPNDILRASSSSGGAIVYSPQIDARGASVEAVARLAQVIEQDKQTFQLRTVTAIQRARKHRVPGL